MSEDESPLKYIIFLFLLGIGTGVFISMIFGVLQPTEIVGWDYPVNPFTFTTMDPPDEAIRIRTSRTAINGTSSFYYEVYVWKISRVPLNEEIFYWTYRQVIAP